MSKSPETETSKRSVEHQPSETAMATATMRALAAHDEREEIRGFDYLAEVLRILLTFGRCSISINLKLSYPTRFTPPFFEEGMKWAYRQDIDFCLSEAAA